MRIQNFLKNLQFLFSSGVIAGCIRWNYLHEGFEEMKILINRYVLIDEKMNELLQVCLLSKYMEFFFKCIFPD